MNVFLVEACAIGSMLAGCPVILSRAGWISVLRYRLIAEKIAPGTRDSPGTIHCNPKCGVISRDSPLE